MALTDEQLSRLNTPNENSTAVSAPSINQQGGLDAYEASLLNTVVTTDKELYKRSALQQFGERLITNVTVGAEKTAAKNGLVFLGDALIGDKAKAAEQARRKKYFENPDIAAIGEISRPDVEREDPWDVVGKTRTTLGRRIRDIGWAWYNDAQRRYLENTPQVAEGEQTNPIATAFADASTSILTSIGLAMTPLGPASAGVAFGALTGTETYLDAETQGKSREIASLLGIVDGVGEYALEKKGLDAILGYGGGILVRGIKTSLTEAFQEMAQTLKTATVRMVGGVDEFTPENMAGVWQDVVLSGAIGAVMGGATGTGLALMNFRRMANGLQKDYGFSREEAKEITRSVFTGAIEQTTDTLQDMGGFTSANLEYQDKQIQLIVGEEQKQPAEMPAVPQASAIPQALESVTDVKLKSDVEGLISENERIDAQLQELSAQQLTATTAEEVDAITAKSATLEEKLLDNKLLLRELFWNPSGWGSARKTNIARTEFIRTQLRQFKAGVAAGKKATAKDIKSFQSYLARLIKVSPFASEKLKNRLLNRVLKVQTEKKFKSTLETFTSTLASIELEYKKQAYRDAVEKMFKLAEGTGSGTNRKTVLDADTQAIFDKLNKIRKDPALYMKELPSETTGDLTTPDELLLYDLRTLATETATLEQLKVAFEDFAQMYSEGKAKFAEWAARRKEQKKQMLKTFIGHVSQRKDHFGLNPLYFLMGARWWPGLQKLVARGSAGAPGKTDIEKMMNVNEATRAEERIVFYAQEKLIRGTMQIYGLKNLNEYVEHSTAFEDVDSDSITVVNEPPTAEIEKTLKEEYGEETGEEIISTLKPKTEQLSRMEAIKRKMEWDSAEGQERLRRKNWYTDETMAEIEEYLTPQDYEFIQLQREIYDELYAGMNKVFRKLRGYNLPYRQNYTPFSADISGVQIFDVDVVSALLSEQNFSDLVFNKSALKALKGGYALEKVSALSAISKYIRDAAHFVGWAETLDNISAIYNNAQVRELMKAKFPEEVLRNIDKYTDAFSAGVVGKGTGESTRELEKLRLKFVKTRLFLKPNQLIKQLATLGYAATEIPAKDLVPGILGTLRDYSNGKLKEFMDDEIVKPFIRSRGWAVDRDLRAALEQMADKRTELYRTLGDNPSFDKVALAFLQAGDRGAVVLSMYSKYLSLKKQGVSDREAKMAAMDLAGRTQQSADIALVSPWFHDRGFFHRTFTSFMQTPNQLFNLYMDMWTDAYKISKPELAKRLVLFHAIMPMLWEVISQAGRFDYKRASQYVPMILGPLAEAVLFGDILAGIMKMIVAEATGSKKDEEVKVDNILISYAESVTGLIPEIKKAITDGVDYDSAVKLLKKLDPVVSVVPYGQYVGPTMRATSDVMRGAKTLSAAADADEPYGMYATAIKQFLGYSDYAITGESKGKRSKRKFQLG